MIVEKVSEGVGSENVLEELGTSRTDIIDESRAMQVQEMDQEMLHNQSEIIAEQIIAPPSIHNSQEEQKEEIATEKPQDEASSNFSIYDDEVDDKNANEIRLLQKALINKQVSNSLIS